MRQRAAMPEWARRRNREREAERTATFNARLGTLVDAAMVDVVWSNDALRPYHVRCRASIPHGPRGTVDIAVYVDDERYTVCAHCGGALRETS